jgi:hypothetical protein
MDRNFLRFPASHQGGGAFVLNRTLVAGVALILFAQVSLGQQTSPVVQATDDSNSPPHESKRLLWVIPNYKTSPSLKNYEPLSTNEKFKLASQDAFDRGTVALAALFGGLGQLNNSNRSFGQGVAGYARYFGASYGDWLIGDYMTEGVYPALLHQDPRYFRRSTGGGWSRLGYAMSQIFWTHRDSGGTQFNYSEVLGNSTAVAISNAYYTDNRTASNAVSSLSVQLGVDMASNVLKEFWPDLERKFRRKHHQGITTQ